MADTRAHELAEQWIAGEWLPKRFGQSFSEAHLPLSPGGVFTFDAVSEDRRIVANISTSAEKTARGKHGTAKVQKIRSDIYFLLLSTAKTKLIVLSEPDMYAWWHEEAVRGRVPAEIGFLHAVLPDELNVILQASRRRASREVTPDEATSR